MDCEIRALHFHKNVPVCLHELLPQFTLTLLPEKIQRCVVIIFVTIFVAFFVVADNFFGRFIVNNLRCVELFPICVAVSAIIYLYVHISM